MVRASKKLVAFVMSAVLLVTLVPTPAFASVTFDPATGTGFSGKGDLQLPWGLLFLFH